MCVMWVVYKPIVTKLKLHIEDNPREPELLNHDKVCTVGCVQAYSHKTLVTL